MQNSSLLFTLIQHEILGTTISDEEKNQITESILPQIFHLAKSHDLVHLLSDAVLRLGIFPEDSIAYERLSQAMALAVYRGEKMQYELNAFRILFEQEQIDFMPLKGAVLRDYYPEKWMRTSCDVDVLVKEQDLEKITRLLLQNGYQEEEKCEHHVSFKSPFGVHLEVHHRLILEDFNPVAAAFFDNIWSKTHLKEDTNHEYLMNNEAYYLYHIAHMAKHFEHGGCGIRPFLDIWVLENKFPFDKEKFFMLLKNCNLQNFYIGALKLMGVWFENKPHDALTQTMQDYILRGGVYGSKENKVAIQQTKKGGKFQYFISRIFPPRAVLQYSYPVLKKCKWLTPLFWVVRWFRVIFKGKTKSSIKELKTGVQLSEEQTEKSKQLLNELGLQ